MPRVHFNRLRALCSDVVGLRRSDQLAEWLRLNRERLQLQQSKITPKKPMSPMSPISPIQIRITPPKSALDLPGPSPYSWQYVNECAAGRCWSWWSS